jgi:snRNA-activating protein complex subunit 3
MPSRQVIEWANDQSRGVGPFSSQRMELTHFIDLKARLGQPYCYMHQGDCEHIIIFTDLRFVVPNTSVLFMYPLVLPVGHSA